jgi:hypothetical protein
MTVVSDLVAIGFVADNDESTLLYAPTGSTIAIVPVRSFYSIQIILPTGAVATCCIHKTALKVTGEVAGVSSASPTANR